jgi:hypothetical protein
MVTATRTPGANTLQYRPRYRLTSEANYWRSYSKAGGRGKAEYIRKRFSCPRGERIGYTIPRSAQAILERIGATQCCQ